MWDYVGKRHGLRDGNKEGRKNRSEEDLGGRTGGELERKSWLQGEI